MTFSIISSNLGGPVGLSYSFTSHLDNKNNLRPTIGLNIHHLNEGSGGSRPVMVCIHGGGWALGDKNNFEDYKPKFFNELGMIFVNINYRLCRPFSTTNDNIYADWNANRVKFPVPVEDCANALKWIQDNISDYGGDPTNINLIGHSAGAHLALLLSTNTDYINAVGVPTSSIRSCISVDTTFTNISNSITENDSTEGNASLLCRNAFGVEYDAGRSGGFNDFSSSAEQTAAYNAGSPDQHISSGIVTNFLLCIQGNADRRNTMISFRDSLQTAGIGNSLCLYFFGNGPNGTYNHEQMQEYIGSPIDKPEGAYVPTQDNINDGHADVGISTFISRYLTQIGII